MANDFPRSDRVAQLLSRGLANLMSKEINDERVKSLTIVEVVVTRDLRHAKVFVVGKNSKDEAVVQNSMQALMKAGKFLRHRIMQTNDMRRCPELHFKYDYSIQRGADMSALIDSVVKPKEG